MPVIKISGKTIDIFDVNGVLINSNQNVLSDIVLTFDLRPDNPEVILEDNIDYPHIGWDINDVVAVVTLVGPQGVIYENDNYNNPDIVPATSRLMTTKIYLPLDPATDYKEILKGNYTLKVSWYNRNLDDYYAFLNTYDFSFVEPTITNKTISGPYTGTLKSQDTTNYGSNVYQIIRTHTVKYPTQLDPVPDDVVSSNEIIQITPIYTNVWTIIISTFVEYRNPDTLRIYWQGEGTFTHCVYGGCISDMHEAIDSLLNSYYLGLACESDAEEIWQKRFAILNTAWHLLNDAYWANDAEEADEQANIIHEQLAAGGITDCTGTTSTEVTPCPEWTGGGGGGGETYIFENGLKEAGGHVTMEGPLIKDTTITIGDYLYKIYGLVGSNEITQQLTATGSQTKVSDGATEGDLQIAKDKISLDYTDLSTPANSRGYEIGASGIVEKADYSAGYVARSLISLEYFQNNQNWGSQVVQSDGTLTGEGTVASPLAVANPFPGFSTLFDDYGYVEPTHSFADLTSHPTTIAGYGITDAVTNFLQLSDTPSAYTGHGGDFVKVNAAGSGLEFVASGNWVPATGGTFTGQVTIAFNNDRPLILRKSGSGGTGGTPEAATNYLSFQDGDEDEQGYAGINSSGDIVLKTNVSGRFISLLNNVNISGNITLTGTVDGVDIAAFKAAYDTHTHTFASITSKPTTLSGYGITDAMSNQADTWPTEFTSKSSAVAADYLVIEDSADGGKKKYVQVGNLPTSAVTFLSLTDTPSSYSGAGGYVLRVNTGASAVEFVDISSTYIKTAAGTLNAYTSKTTPADNDVILIEDSADSYKQKKILVSSLPGSGGSGDMSKSVYDTDDDGVVDDAEKLGNQSPSYYLDWNNFTNTPSDLTVMSNYTTDDLSEGTTNLYFNCSRVSACPDVADNTAKRHDPLTVVDSDTIDFTLTAQQLTADIIYQQSITADTSGIKLVGDVVTPGNSKYYGTNSSGTKGWYDLPSPGPTYTFTNGLTESSGTVELGGNITSVTLTGSAFVIRSTATSYPRSQIVLKGGSGSYMTGQQDANNFSQVTVGENGDLELRKTISGTAYIVNMFNGGLKYADNYSANGASDDRWIPDYAAVKAYADSVAQSVSFGAAGQIAYTNTGTDDFSYSSLLSFDGQKFTTGYMEFSYNASAGTPGSSKGWLYLVYSNPSYDAYFKNGAGTEYLLSVFTSGTDGIRTDYSVGIGAGASSTYKLYVSGEIYSTSNMRATDFIQTSDYRLKTDIEELSNGLDIVLDLQPKMFYYKENLKRLHFGFIAQDVAKILPSIVDEDERGYKMFSYTQLIAPTIGAVQNHEQRIRELERENTTLKKRIKILEDERA